MTGRSASPFPLVQPYSGLGLGEMISEHQGQARLVCMLASHPGWIYKEYKAALRPSAEAELDLLINLPARLTPADRLLINGGTSWPSARVVKEDRTWGVVLPLAPTAFTAEIRVLGGVKRGPLTIDWLAQPAAMQRHRGVEPPSLAQRVAACASLARTAAALERHGVVYLDWSFGNAFWSHREHTTYLIDMDGCTFGNRTMIESPGWEDHLYPMGTVGGLPVDRFRVALLVSRCLIEERTASAEAAATKLAELAGRHRELVPVQAVVSRALRGARPEDRASLVDLAAVLTAAATALAHAPATQGGAPGWRPYSRPGTAPQAGRPASATTATGPHPPIPTRPYTPAIPGQRRLPVPAPPSVPAAPVAMVPATPAPGVPDTVHRPRPVRVPVPVPPRQIDPPRPFTPPVTSGSGSGSGGSAALAAGVVMAIVAIIIIIFIIGALSGH